MKNYVVYIGQSYFKSLAPLVLMSKTKFVLAVIDCITELVQEINEWAVIDPLPSYGHGRDAAGGRYISLLFGTNLTDVIITGKLAFYQQLYNFYIPFISQCIYTS